jgi:protein-S-isoprenylcysteine O-methyltransferase Ste14
MKASAFEFRFRMWISAALVVMGFWSPWLNWFPSQLPSWLPASLQAGTRTTTWLWLGFELGSFGISSTTGIEIVTGVTILVAVLAAWLRIWGSAYLGPGIVQNREMKAGQVMADGPYRFVRNPLYLGSFGTIMAVAILMPPSGALVSLLLLAIFLLRLILGEEAFLAPKLGEPYAGYRKAVPRLIPLLRSRVASAGLKPEWGHALLTEIFPLAVPVCFAALSWQYNSQLLIRAVLISFGLSLVVRAMVVPKTNPAQTTV